MPANALGTQEFAGRLISLLPRLLRGLSKREENPLSQGKISLPQMLALDYLSRVDRATMTELAQCLSIKMGSATGLVDRLIKAGFVKRLSDPGDRRVVWIRITAGGKKVITTILVQKRKTMAEVFAKIPRHEREQYIRTFEKVCDILDSEGT